MQYLYRAYDNENNLLYVGMTQSLRNRIRTHIAVSNWMEKTDWIKIERYPDRKSVMEAERSAIKNELPERNIQHRQKFLSSETKGAAPKDEFEIAKLRREALNETRDITNHLVELVREEAARGVTEVELARRAKVTRMTIRKWLGK